MGCWITLRPRRASRTAELLGDVVLVAAVVAHRWNQLRSWLTRL
jgi:hypothetical protein